MPVPQSASPTAAPRRTGWAMLAAAVVMLGAAVFLGSLMVGQSQALQTNVEYTQSAVNANVRTLGQVQRELLRLEVLLAAPPPVSAPALDLQLALVDQRIQEGALPLQAQTLGSDALLARSADAALAWTDEIRPEVVAGAQGPPATRTAAVTAVVDLEKRYNALISDGEINRRLRAGEANGQTRQLLHQARLLMVGLGITLTGFLVFAVVSGWAFRQLNRSRDAAGRQLVALNQELWTANTELRTHALVVHATDNLVLITDPDGRIEWVNAAFERTTGHRLHAVRGQRPGSFLQGPDTDPATVAVMREALANGRDFTVEILNYAITGDAYWVRVEAHPVRDDAGVITHFIAIEADVTERRRTEENLRAATETALSLAQEKAAFLATMSHEIRTPLNAVLGTTELLGHTALDVEQADLVRTANNSGRLLLSLINDILDFSALESGHVEVEHRPFDVRLMLADVIGMFETDAAGRGVALQCRVAADVATMVVADENRIRQVLLNLVGNGLKFTHRGAVTVEVRALPDLGPAGGMRLRVIDTGIGIPQDRQERVFLPFTQVDPSTTRRYGGSGLGLSICRLIVRHLGGDITLRSRPGEGSVFTVDVPVGVAPPVVAAAPVAETGGPTDLDLRVLVAEDDPVNRMVVVRMLARLGVTADVVTDGREAVEAVGRKGYDVVFMDVNMPQLDGVAATAEIRSRLTSAAQPWVVALTANALDGDRDKLIAAGMDSYVSKPVTVAALAGALGEYAPRTRRPQPVPLSMG